MLSGWAGEILRVDLSATEITKESTNAYNELFVAGRGISVKIIYDELPTEVTPSDSRNRLCFGPGLLSGTPAAGSSRMKVSAIGAGGALRHAGIGAHIPAAIKRAGYDLIVVQGKAEGPVYLVIEDENVEIKDATHIWGKDTYQTQQIIQNEIGNAFEVMCIGRAGENSLAFASIHSGLGSAAGRCGLGGVMGSKNLKAIAVKGNKALKLANSDEFLKVVEQQRRSFAANNEAVMDMNRGADRWAAWYVNQTGFASRGNWEACDWGWDLQFTKMDEFAEKYGVASAVCGSCPISHFIIYDYPQIGSSTAKCVGTLSVTSTLWNNDWRVAYRAYHLINSYGMDVVSTTNIIAFMMELYAKGIITAEDTDGIPMIRGNEDAIIWAIQRIANQEGFGRVFRNGVIEGAKKIGRGAEDFAMAIKGLEIQPHEQRMLKQVAFANATNTKDYVDSANLIAFNYAENPDKVARERLLEKAKAVYGDRKAALPTSPTGIAFSTVIEEGIQTAGDIVGVCKYLIPFYATQSLKTQAKLCSLATGVPMTEEHLLFIAQRVITLERACNVIRGFDRKDDTLPKRFFNEPVPAGPCKGEKLSRKMFEKTLNHYYELHRYDKQGIPTREAFKKYGLLAEWETFKKTLNRKVKASK